MPFRERTVKKNYVYRGRILNLRADEVSVKGGGISVREIVEHGGGCAIYCEKDGKVLLVKQFRYAYGEEVWELPAGKAERGEAPEKTAARELEEECGIKAEKLSLMYTVYPSPGYTGEVIRIYRAEGFAAGHAHQDEDEDVAAEWIDKEKARLMIKNGEIKDGKTLIALLSEL